MSKIFILLMFIIYLLKLSVACKLIFGIFLFKDLNNTYIKYSIFIDLANCNK